MRTHKVRITTRLSARTAQLIKVRHMQSRPVFYWFHSHSEVFATGGWSHLYDMYTPDSAAFILLRLFQLLSMQIHLFVCFSQWAPIIFLIFVSSSITPNGTQSESKWGWTHRDAEGGGVAGASATHWIPPAAGLNTPLSIWERPLVLNTVTDIEQVPPGFQTTTPVMELMLADYCYIGLRFRWRSITRWTFYLPNLKYIFRK